MPGNAPTVPLNMIPPPPLIHTFQPLPSFLPNSPIFQQSFISGKSHYENLNPNVPEFVPVKIGSDDQDGDLSDAEEVIESTWNPQKLKCVQPVEMALTHSCFCSSRCRVKGKR